MEGWLIMLMVITLGLAFPAVVILARLEMERDRRESEEWIRQFEEKFGRK